MNERRIPKCIKQLILIRKHHGYTQQDIADKTGFTLSYITKLENGDRSPSLNSLQILAKAYGGLDADVSITNWQ